MSVLRFQLRKLDYKLAFILGIDDPVVFIAKDREVTGVPHKPQPVSLSLAIWLVFSSSTSASVMHKNGCSTDGGLRRDFSPVQFSLIYMGIFPTGVVTKRLYRGLCLNHLMSKPRATRRNSLAGNREKPPAESDSEECHWLALVN